MPLSKKGWLANQPVERILIAPPPGQAIVFPNDLVDAAPRSIAVAYDGGINIAFDPVAMTLASA